MRILLLNKHPNLKLVRLFAGFFLLLQFYSLSVVLVNDIFDAKEIALYSCIAYIINVFCGLYSHSFQCQDMEMKDWLNILATRLFV